MKKPILVKLILGLLILIVGGVGLVIYISNENPRYSDIIKTYPAYVTLSCTNTNLSSAKDGTWAFEGGVLCVSTIGDQPDIKATPPKGEIVIAHIDSLEGLDFIKQFGTKVTLNQATTINGKTFEHGAMLTVDKNLNWIEVSTWE